MNDTRSLLVIGHPGHELRAYGWIAETQPLVCVLTDGGGSNEASRLDHTARLLCGLGARVGPLFGELTDRAIYDLILRHDYAPFTELAQRLANLLVDASITTVVSDGIEGYNPTHDVCEVLTSTAIALAGVRSGHSSIRHSAFALTGDPRLPPGFDRSAHGETTLSEDLVRQKKAAALAYARLGGSRLLQEVEQMLDTFGDTALSRERWFSGIEANGRWVEHFSQRRPFYEQYGQQQVAAGKYRFVIRFAEHVLPLVQHLSALATPIVENPNGSALHARAHH